MRPRSAAVLVAALALACTCLAFACPALAAEPESAQIEILSPEKIEVPADAEGSEEVLLKNGGGTPVVVGFEVNGEYAPEVFPASAEVLAYSVRRVTLYFTPDKAGQEVSGELIASGESTAPDGIPFESTTSHDAPDWLYAIVLGGFAAVLALILLRLFRRAAQ